MTYEEAKRLAYRRLAMRAHHSLEMGACLAEKGAAGDIIAQLMSELTSLGYLNDEEWVAGRIRTLRARKYGPKIIAYKLAAVGIPAEEYLPQLEELKGCQPAHILTLLQTKYRARNLVDFKQRQKVIAALVRKGYDLSDIIQTIKSII